MDSKHADTTALYQGYAAGRIGRREFMQRATALGVAGVAVSLLDHLGAAPAEAAAVTNAAVAAGTAVDVAEWSYFWLGVQRARLARGTVVNGEQMYVEYQVPTQLRHPYPIVLVHGGGGQGVCGGNHGGKQGSVNPSEPLVRKPQPKQDDCGQGRLQAGQAWARGWAGVGG